MGRLELKHLTYEGKIMSHVWKTSHVTHMAGLDKYVMSRTCPPAPPIGKGSQNWLTFTSELGQSTVHTPCATFLDNVPNTPCNAEYLTWCGSCRNSHCNTLQHTATHCNTLQHTATHCNTLQHTATHCPHTMCHILMVWFVPITYCHRKPIKRCTYLNDMQYGNLIQVML